MDETRLKGNSKLEQARRLTYLRLLHARLFEERDQLERDEIVAIIKSAGWFDNNTISRILSNAQDFTVGGSAIGLLAPGRDRAFEILSEVFDENIPPPSFDVSRGKSGKKLAGSGEKQADDDKKSSNRKGTKRQSSSIWLTEWKKLALLPQGAGHEILKDRSLIDRGLFGLWAIRRAVGDAGRAVTAYSLETFLFQAFEIKADRSYLARNLISNATKGKVTAVEGSKFQILPPGIAYIEQMAGLLPRAVTAAPTDSAPVKSDSTNDAALETDAEEEA